jgi:hypothetical protein
MSLVDLLKNNLNNNVGIELTKAEIEYLKIIINKQPDLFDNINNSINSIISDGKIDLHDIPEIILLISNIINSHIIENLIEDVGLINIVKFIIDSIIDSNLLPIPVIEKIIIKKIVDTSISLLKLNSNFIKKKTVYCYNYFFNRFCK